MTPPAGLTVILIVGVTAVALAAYEYFFASPRRENFNRYDRSSNYIPESLYAPQIQSKEDADSKNVRQRRRRNSNESCTICLGSLNKELREYPCSHVFHAHCIECWISLGNRSCPICRANI